MTDEPSDSDAEVLLEWAERVVVAEDDLVDDEREEALEHDLDAAVVGLALLHREVDHADQLTPQQHRELTAAFDAEVTDLEQLLRHLNPGRDPR